MNELFLHEQREVSSYGLHPPDDIFDLYEPFNLEEEERPCDMKEVRSSQSPSMNLSRS